ncbi:hypothetical protein HMPREF0367_01420 [[Eubacterium] cylindroides ATCC 27803]|uniref:Uncharacterized protein n=1 Tax=Faecalitalea cylindroides ATCC 27803 TaxID=649755 RepID=U2R0B8_9FIRM|nr:hypothetical protein HMPREF0367_01420 [[Eubacterium] cylindroides ATCC 27803] [Faecalitalea cylindroides ATCC 27803]
MYFPLFILAFLKKTDQPVFFYYKNVEIVPITMLVTINKQTRRIIPFFTIYITDMIIT